MERFKKGTVVQLKRRLGDAALKGYLYLVKESTEREIDIINILPNTGMELHLAYDTSIDVDRNLIYTGLSTTDVLNSFYSLVDDGTGGKVVIESAYVPLTKEKVNDKLTIDILKSIFKYIPIFYDGNNGFYYNGNIIVKKPIIKKRYRLSRSKNKPRNANSVCITPRNEENILKMFSESALKTQCLFKVKDYKLSSKLFGFTESKKTMVGKTVEISKIEFQADVKKSNKRENTVYIKVEDRNLRFSLDDIEIIYPNVNGWSEPKNRVIKNGSIVKLVSNKDFKYIPKGTQVKVSNIRDVGNKRYIGFIYNDKKTIGKLKSFKLV